VVHKDDDEREVILVDELEVLPDQTRDDTAEGWGDPADDRESWLLAERPPHW
jgi:hypothetical protein